MRIYRTTMSAQNSDLVRLQETIYNSKNSTRKWLHSSRREWITTAIERMAAQGKDSALEVGAGIGIYTPVLAKNFNKVVAIDIQTDYLCHAEALTKKYNHVRFLVDDITRSSLPSHSFDLVLCTEVIGTLQFTDYTFTAMAGPGASKAALTSPAPGSVLPGTTATFSWRAGSGGVTAYVLYVGTTRGGS